MNIDTAKTALNTLACSPPEKPDVPVISFVAATWEEIQSARRVGHTWRAIYNSIRPHILSSEEEPLFSQYSLARMYKKMSRGKTTGAPSLPAPARKPAPSSPGEDIYLMSNGDQVPMSLINRISELFICGFSADKIAGKLNNEDWVPPVGDKFTKAIILTLLEQIKINPPKKKGAHHG